MSTVGWRSTQFKAWANVDVTRPGGPVTVYRAPVVSFQANFDLNAIPTAVLQLGVGRNVRSTKTISAAHPLLDSLKLLSPIRVWLQAFDRAFSPDGEAPLGQEWPDVPFVLFDGYVAGVGSDTGAGRAGITLHCIHWLADMSFSSAISRSSMPSNTTALSYGAGFRGRTDDGQTPFPTGNPQKFMNQANVLTDLWGQSIAPWFDSLCSQDRFDIADLPVEKTGPLSKNYEALRALLRFEGYPGGLLNRYAPTMPLDNGLLGAERLPDALSGLCTHQGHESMATTTLWDKLVGDLGAQLLFSVVPMIDRALVVPFIPGLRRARTQITASEYEAIGSQSALSRPLRAVCLAGGAGSATGGQRPALPNESYVPQGIGGVWPRPSDPVHDAEPDLRAGLVLVRQLPLWLGQIMTVPLFGRSSAPPDDVSGGAAFPRAGAAPVAALPGAIRPAVISFWDRFARALYLVERLKGRQLSLRTNFRLDLSPGSTATVVSSRDRFIEAVVGKQADVLWAHVSRVTLVLDAEGRQAHTLLQLSHLRTARENALATTGTDNHPLWKTVFLGAPLTSAMGD